MGAWGGQVCPTYSASPFSELFLFFFNTLISTITLGGRSQSLPVEGQSWLQSPKAQVHSMPPDREGLLLREAHAVSGIKAQQAGVISPNSYDP